MTTNRGNYINTEGLEEALERCFISPNVSDSNFEAANLVDVVDRAARNLRQIAKGIAPPDALPYQGPGGVRVSSLTEAVIFLAENVGSVAAALSEIAAAIKHKP